VHPLREGHFRLVQRLGRPMDCPRARRALRAAARRSRQAPTPIRQGSPERRPPSDPSRRCPRSRLQSGIRGFESRHSLVRLFAVDFDICRLLHHIGWWKGLYPSLLVPRCYDASWLLSTTGAYRVRTAGHVSKYGLKRPQSDAKEGLVLNRPNVNRWPVGRCRGQ
jgi:hypothetical protein